MKIKVPKNAIASAVLLCALFLFCKQPVNAEDTSVAVSFSSSYTVDDQNQALVRVIMTFKNTGENPTILTSYNLNLGNVAPSEISTSHDGAALEYQILEQNGFIIKVFLGEPLLRVDETYSAEVDYKIGTFFTQIGGGYDCILPIFQNSSNALDDSIVITYPVSFGGLNYANVATSAERKDADYIVTLNHLNTVDHVFVSIGNSKFFTFSIERDFKNDQDMYVKQDIVIPPDTSTQELVLSSIAPYPSDAYKTIDGNYVLSYDIAPKQELWVRISGYIVSKINTAPLVTLTSQEMQYFKESQGEYWELTDERVLADLATVDSSLSAEEKVNWIYSYVMTNLKLSSDFRSLHAFEYRKGANTSLVSYKDASVEDFADAFVAVARALDVPARLVAGYVYPFTISGQQLGMYHIWPQYWTNERGWISVDPAYEKYTGYLQRDQTGINRVIMAISPDNLDTLDLDETSNNIFFTNEAVQPISMLNADVTIADTVEAGITNTGVLGLTNSGNTVLSDISFTPANNDFGVVFEESPFKRIILPGESADVDFSSKVKIWNTRAEKPLIVDVVAESPEGTQRATGEKTVQIKAFSWGESIAWVVTVIIFSLICGICYLVSVIIGKIMDRRKAHIMASKSDKLNQEH